MSKPTKEEITKRNTLSDGERVSLKKCEAVIALGFRHFMEVATALLKISDERLYRETHSTFEQYCKETLRISASRAYQLCDAGGVIKNLHNCGETVQPTREAQLRPLSCVEPEKQAEVWKAAVEISGGEQPSAKQVDSAVDKVIKPKVEVKDIVCKPEPVSDELAAQMTAIAAKKDRDAIKQKIQKHADTWKAQKYVSLLISELRELLTSIEPAEPSNVLPLERKTA